VALPDSNEQFNYDATGNRTSGGTVTPSGNRPREDGTYTYGYDDEGNLTRRTNKANNEVTTYTFDYRNRLTRMERRSAGGVLLGDANYTYDVNDRLIIRSVDGATTTTLYDGDEVWADYTAAGQVVTRYFHGEQTDEHLARWRPSAGLAWYLSDRQGSVVDLVDGAGALLNHLDYGAFGQILAQTNAANGDRFTYTGREYEARLGLYWYRARWYDPNGGRFMSEDPMGFGAGDVNLRRYVGNAPTNWIDPSGLYRNPPPAPVAPHAPVAAPTRNVPYPTTTPRWDSRGQPRSEPSPAPRNNPYSGPNPYRQPPSSVQPDGPRPRRIRPPEPEPTRPRQPYGRDDFSVAKRRVARLHGTIEYAILANAIAGTILSAQTTQNVRDTVAGGRGGAGAQFKGFALGITARMSNTFALTAAVVKKDNFYARLQVDRYSVQRLWNAVKSSPITVLEPIAQQEFQQEQNDCDASGTLYTQRMPLTQRMMISRMPYGLRHGRISGIDPNTYLGPYNDGDVGRLTGEYRYSLIVVWTGQHLDKCRFRRVVDSNSLMPGGVRLESGLGFGGATALANERLSQPDDDRATPNYNQYVRVTQTIAVQYDAPGLWFSSFNFADNAPFYYYANFLAYAESIETEQIVGRVWYTVMIDGDFDDQNQPVISNQAFLIGTNP
jgi:RHS repeat-associated protein